MKFILLITVMLTSGLTYAGVYKCTDQEGKTAYQTTPCEDIDSGAKFNTDTGTSSKLEDETINIKLEMQKKAMEKQKQMEFEKQQQLLKKQTQAESMKNQQWIKDNPGRYSAFAIPPYADQKHPDFVNEFAWRLPEIEQLRRKAAELALASGKCGRVEASEVNPRSTDKNLVFLVDCSSGESFYLQEQQINPSNAL